MMKWIAVSNAGGGLVLYAQTRHHQRHCRYHYSHRQSRRAFSGLTIVMCMLSSSSSYITRVCSRYRLHICTCMLSSLSCLRAYSRHICSRRHCHVYCLRVAASSSVCSRLHRCRVSVCAYVLNTVVVVAIRMLSSLCMQMLSSYSSGYGCGCVCVRTSSSRLFVTIRMLSSSCMRMLSSYSSGCGCGCGRGCGCGCGCRCGCGCGCVCVLCSRRRRVYSSSSYSPLFRCRQYE